MDMKALKMLTCALLLLGGALIFLREFWTPHDAIVSGGIGQSAQARLRSIENQYNLKLVFMPLDEAFDPDVRVTIADAYGRRLAERALDGPILMARLPAGSYSISAIYRGGMESRQVSIGADLRTEYFRWPANAAVTGTVQPGIARAPAD